MTLHQPPRQPPPGPAHRAITVPELIAHLERLVAEHGPGRIELTGTLSSWRLNRGWASGELISHHDGTVDARFPFAIQRRGLPADIIGNDMVVAITGTIETRPPWHPLRLQGEHLRLIARSSVAARTREQLLETMRRDGRLTAQKRLQLPDAAVTIGLVTSAGSAARADIAGHLHRNPRTGPPHRRTRHPHRPRRPCRRRRRHHSARHRTTRRDHRRPRWGSDRRTLATFDAEDVANAIAASPVPVITAIGHATDTTVADHVAHTHVLTPTAAAGLIAVGHQRQRQRDVDLVTRRQLDTARAQAELARQATERAARQRRIALVALGIAALLIVVLGALSALR